MNIILKKKKWNYVSQKMKEKSWRFNYKYHPSIRKKEWQYVRSKFPSSINFPPRVFIEAMTLRLQLKTWNELITAYWKMVR